MIPASDRNEAIALIDEAVSNGAKLNNACKILDLTERTYYRWKKRLKETGSTADLRPTAKRPTPANKLTDEEKKQIIQVVNQKEYASLSPAEIVPALADEGIYIASESSFYRVLREFNMQHHRGRSESPMTKTITTHRATAPNQVWMWDITYLNGPIKGKFYYLYLISDLFSRKIIAWEVWENESATHASELIRRAVLSEKISVPRKQPLILHSDNGSPMKGATMLETLYHLGITPSNSRPRVSNDNPYAESLFKTLKYRCNYQPKGFIDLSEARLWCKNFVHWYNHEHHHSGIKFVTPHQRHTGIDQKIIEKRKQVYEAAKQKHPERWTRSTRDWTLPTEVYLNPEKAEHQKVSCEAEESAS